MKILTALASLCLLPAIGACSEPRSEAPAIQLQPTDWAWWRGPARNGHADSNQQPPLTWSESENVLWRTAIPGRGHGSPTVVGDRLYVATAVSETQQQLVICLDRNTGQQLWSTAVHEKGFPDPSVPKASGNAKASLASATIACDGTSLFINFLNAGAVYTTALTLDGKQVWQTKITDYVVHQGYGSSPAIYEHLVIVSADNKGGGAVAGLHRATGKIEWKRERPALPNYASPIILNIVGKDQCVLTGCDLVTSLNPLTGETLWETEGATTECVTSTVTDGLHVYTSGGYPKNHISAVAADGSKKLAWENSVRAYVPSLLEKDGYLYAALDVGVATCWNAATGEEVWKGRLAGTFSSSPVLVGNRIYATNEEGTTFVFMATPDGFQKLATNQLGESVFATPTFCHSKVFARVAHQTDGQRQEFVYCLGK